jgi:class I fructose-bisphosphate aldolase
MTQRVKEILSWYGAESPGVLTNLARLLNHGRLGGTGKLVILPVDQGFEHGPARSFAPNPPAYDPLYHFRLAIEAGCNAYAAPLGFLEAGAREFAGEIPLILKANDSDSLRADKDPAQALTGSVEDALRLGCCAVGFTIYPGSAFETQMYGQLRVLAEEARRHGLAVVVWSYPRGSSLSKDGETAIDVVGYGAQIAAQLGAHVIKVKLPTAHIEQEAARKVYEAMRLRRPADRDLLRRRRRGRRRRLPLGDPRHPGRRRLRLDHRPQLLPAHPRARPEAARRGHGHLRRLTVPPQREDAFAPGDEAARQDGSGALPDRLS